MYLEDERLSWKAKGLLSYFLDRSCDGKVARISNAFQDGLDNEDSFLKGLDELARLGYLIWLPAQQKYLFLSDLNDYGLDGLERIAEKNVLQEANR